MKIALNTGQSTTESTAAADARTVEHDVLAAQAGDWNARSNVARAFHNLLTSLSEKRSQGNAELKAKYYEAGKNGLFKAIKKYHKRIGADRFQLFALDFIEAGMDHADRGGGLLHRLFGK